MLSLVENITKSAKCICVYLLANRESLYAIQKQSSGD